MNLTLSYLTILPVVSLGIAVILIIRAWRHRSRPIARTFMVMMLALAWWSMCVGFENLFLDLTLKTIWVKLSYLGITSLPLAWLIFSLQYTERFKWVTKRYIAVLAILPILTLLVVWTNDALHLMWLDFRLDTSVAPPVDAVTHNFWFWINVGYSYLFILLGTICLVSSFLRAPNIQRKQVGTLLIAAFAPWIGNLFYVLGIGPFKLIDPTPLTFAISGIAFFWSILRFQLLNIVPIAHEAVFKSMVDGAVVINPDRRIIELNPAAEEILNLKRSTIIGQLIDRVLPENPNLTNIRPDITGTQSTICIGEGTDRRFYNLFTSPIIFKQHFNGQLILLHDDTARRNAETESTEKAVLQAELMERRKAQQIIQDRLDFEETIARISSRFVGAEDIERAINDSLGDIGRLARASRAHLFLFNNKDLSLENSYEWCLDGISRQIENLGNLGGDNFPWLMSMMNNGETVNLKELSQLPAEARIERALFISQDVKSVLALPISFKGKIIGFADIVKTKRSEDWTDNDLALLRISSEIMVNAFERRQAAFKLSELNKKLKTLNLRLEAKVEERTKQLAEAAVLANAANQAKSQFLASMSHELRTPLNAVLGFSQILDEQYFGNLNEKQSEYVKDIMESGRHLLSLINDVLDLSKIEAGKVELEWAPVNIKELLQGSLVMIKEKALSHRIALNVILSEDIVSLEIPADARRLKQVMFNLLSNATKFTPDGGKITIEAHKNKREIMVSVIDTGIGISGEEQKKIFQDFYQVNNGLQNKNAGTGLGLAITKNIIREHGGKIWVESEGENKGSRFTFILPLNGRVYKEKVKVTRKILATKLN